MKIRYHVELIVPGDSFDLDPTAAIRDVRYDRGLNRVFVTWSELVHDNG